MDSPGDTGAGGWAIICDDKKQIPFSPFWIGFFFFPSLILIFRSY
jgi:hypothetical protein